MKTYKVAPDPNEDDVEGTQPPPTGDPITGTGH